MYASTHALFFFYFFRLHALSVLENSQGTGTLEHTILGTLNGGL